MSNAFLFIDSEFTSFEEAQLISIALAHNEQDNIYLEFSDYDTRLCSPFVQSTVLPLLEHKAQLSAVIVEQIFSYLQAKSKEGAVYIVGDYAGDWELFLSLMRAKGGKKALGVAGFINLYDYLTYVAKRDIKNGEVLAATLDNLHTLYSAHTQHWFITHQKKEHHALFDALANRHAFSQTLQYIRTAAAGTQAP